MFIRYRVQKKKSKKETVGKWLAVMIVLLFVLLTGRSVAVAANSTVEIHIGDSDSSRHHMAMEVGSTSAEFSFELRGYQAKSSRYTSSNERVFKIISTSEGKCKVEGVSEGTGMLTLEIKTSEGSTLEEKVFISVYTRINPCKAVIKNNTSVYRCASDNAKVENEDEKGKLARGANIQINAACDGYYFFTISDGTTFIDDSSQGFVKKSAVNVPVTGITLSSSTVNLEVGETVQLNADIQPEQADNKGVTWKSSHPLIASVSNTGEVTAKKEGNATITATTLDGGMAASCKVNVKYQGTKGWNAAKAENPKIKTSGMTIKAVSISESKIKITWKKKSKVKKYILYRATKKKGKYKKIKTISKKKNAYVDKKLKASKKYFYRLLVVKKSGKKFYSKKASATTMKKYDISGNLKYFQENYKDVCVDPNQDMNQYSSNGYYSAVKYQFDGKCLQIHLYIDFVRYANSNVRGSDGQYVYKRYDADRNLKFEGETYVNLFLEGLKQAYDNVSINGTSADLSGKQFYTKLVVHDRKDGTAYHGSQNFIEVMIGGECPNSRLGTNGTYWYHMRWRNGNSSDALVYSDMAIIYMPTQRELIQNDPKGKYPRVMNKDWYMHIAGHEMGHVLGLGDAYTEVDAYTEKNVDRCNENLETCKKFDEIDEIYDNIMVEKMRQLEILPNDLEMMLEAYRTTGCRPWDNLQRYKDHEFEGYSYTMSLCIKSDRDFNETGTK